MRLPGALSGFLKVELTGAVTEKTLSFILSDNIPIFHVQQAGELSVTFFIRSKDLDRVTRICSKRGDRVLVQRRMGLYWTVSSIRSRILLSIGIITLVLLTLLLPTKVFFFRVEGNTEIPAAKIISVLEENGIGFGVSRRVLRSEKAKNVLLAEIPGLQWAGINTYGCTAVISVREGIRTVPSVGSKSVSSIVSAMDAVVESCSVTRGNCLVSPGDAVQKGQVLISAYTDCGICIRATSAEGEIFGQTNRKIDAVTPHTFGIKGPTIGKTKKYSIKLGKKRINLWNGSGILEGSCDRIYKEYYVSLPGGFTLPAAFCIDELIQYSVDLQQYPEEETVQLLKSFDEAYLTQNMVAGTVTDIHRHFSWDKDICRMQGNYVCTEMIGRIQAEQIGAHNGKNN